MTAAVPTPGAHGGDGPAVAAALGLDPDNLLDLSQSLNPVAPDVASIIADHLDEVGRYPGDPARATASLAEAIDIPVDHLLLTNGGAEAIHLAAATLGGGVATEPEFGLHPRDDHGPRWRSNPHNPSGLLALAGEVADVWDEAFYPLATGAWTRGDLDRGALVVGSLTKVWACPGLRLGYLACADDRLMATIRARQPAWSVNALALAALPELLARTDLPAWAETIGRLRAELVALLAAHGLEARPSEANWVLVEAPGDLRERLARQGVLVRDCASFGMPGTVRIAVPDTEGLFELKGALWRLR